ncbi:MAG TPA: FAD binding domain-containing protein [Solirubrobacteraceae bacterium]|jgi:CO/xanthine dehydrogenase FAD-binding subunit|nr:FAD binding domain-containing protein [Solirubrobacteraceae bacterium]
MGVVDAPEVIVAGSREEAVSAFGDGADVTVIAGATIVMPDITHGRLHPRRALLIAGAGLSGVRSEQGRTTIGATTTISELEDAAEPLGACARGLADYEIRGQATLGGNLCASPGEETPRGDLQAALLALDARVRSTGAGGERSEPVEDFLAAGPAGRLVLDVEFAEPQAGASAVVRRPHAHAYTIMRVCAARVGGELRVAVSGAGPTAVRSRAVESALADGADAATAAERVLDDVTPHDDALASSWYRGRTLPVLVRRALDDLR